MWTVDGEEVGRGDTFTLEGCDDLRGTLTVTASGDSRFFRDDTSGLLAQSLSWPIRTKKCGGCEGCSTGRPAGLAVLLLGLAALLGRRR